MRKALALALIMSGFFASAAMADTYDTAAHKLLGSKPIKAASTHLSGDYDHIVNDLIDLTEIPAPPFGEAARAKAFMAKLSELGLSEVEMDAEGNVYGTRRGTQSGGGVLVVAAHLDTVFPAGTDVKVRRDNDRLYAPGIGDDTSGLASMLGLIRAMDAAGIKTKHDIVFVGNVGEEGLGDLRGTRYLFNKGRYRDQIFAFISIEPGDGSGLVNQGIGSRRFKVEFVGPGGHSFGDFGIVNPAYALAEAVTRLSHYEGPMTQQTTYNVGVISGGTSVNSIPFNVAMSVDMRSRDGQELSALSDYFLSQLPLATAAENARHSTKKGAIEVKITPIGERPTGLTPEDSFIVKSALSFYRQAGFKPSLSANSTDSNVPMSKNIPAITIGSGFDGDGAHSPQEYITLDKPKALATMTANIAIIVTLANKGRLE